MPRASETDSSPLARSNHTHHERHDVHLTDNTVFIPGATSGIGLGLALELHRRGNIVIIGGRRTELLERIASENPGIETVEIDTSDPESIATASEDVRTRFPATNVLIAMAGIMLPEDLGDPGFVTTAETTVITNLLGPIRLVAEFVPFLKERDRAVIMTVTSGLGFVPLSFTPTYSATKAAVHSFTVSLRQQLSSSGIEVLELAPPSVRTPLMGQDQRGSGMPLQDFLDEVLALLSQDPTPEEILVEDVKALRFAEARGTYSEMLAMLSQNH